MLEEKGAEPGLAADNEDNTASDPKIQKIKYEVSQEIGLVTRKNIKSKEKTTSI